VVCGVWLTAATFSPTSWFNNVDFPAFGRPMMATVAYLRGVKFIYFSMGMKNLKLWNRRFRRLHRLIQADFVIGVIGAICG
jgi:hypothetical protein